MGYIDCICIRENCVRKCSPALKYNHHVAKLSAWSLLGVNQDLAEATCCSCVHLDLGSKRWMVGMWAVAWLLSFERKNNLRHIQRVSRHSTGAQFPRQVRFLCFWAQHFKGTCDKALSSHPAKSEPLYFASFWHVKNFRQPQQPVLGKNFT